MYYFLFTVLAASLVTIAVVVVRKFPQLANVDVASLPTERESEKKRALVRSRLDDQRRRWQSGLKNRLSPLGKVWGRVQLQFRVYVGKIERLMHHEQRLKLKNEMKKVSGLERENRLAQIVADGQAALADGNFNRAEELFITAIKLDTQYAPAYRGLGDTYSQKGSLAEAKDTYKFVVKLNPSDDTTLVRLAEIAEQEASYEEAIQYYEKAAVLNDSLSPRFYHLGELLLKVGQPETAREAALSALELEPKNPKYLDLAIESAILSLDAETAETLWAELRLINPENNKLLEFRERIDAMAK